MSTPFDELTQVSTLRPVDLGSGLAAERGVPLPGEPPTPEAIELDPSGRAYLAELEDAHAAKTAAEERIEYATTKLQALLGETPEATVDGRPVLSWRPYVRKSFDQRTAKRFLTAEQVEACQRETVVRPFRRVTGE